MNFAFVFEVNFIFKADFIISVLLNIYIGTTERKGTERKLLTLCCRYRHTTEVLKPHIGSTFIILFKK